jgi:enoyl-CoA hydratase
MNGSVTVARHHQIRIVTLDDGNVNLLTEYVMTDLLAALADVEDDVTSIVVTGREGCLSAGFDRDSVTGDRDRARGTFALATRLYRAIAEAPRPVVMACPGHALAAGALLLLCADVPVGGSGQG